MGRYYAAVQVVVLFVLLHGLDLTQNLLQLLGVSLDVGGQDRQQVLISPIYFFQSNFKCITNCINLVGLCSLGDRKILDENFMVPSDQVFFALRHHKL